MGHRIFKFLLAATVLAACSETEAPPAAPIKVTTAYQDIFLEAEAKLGAEQALGVMFVHPLLKRTCKTIMGRISRKVYTGIEHRWHQDAIIEIKQNRTAPSERRQIGLAPAFFDMEPEGTYRLDALSCEAFDKTVTTQYATFATFDAVPGKLSFIGDFAQTRMVEGVDFYIPTQDVEAARAAIELDSPKLAKRLIKAVITPFSFTNYDGREMTAQQVSENVGQSADYFTLSQTLKEEATEALLPLLDPLPEVPPLPSRVAGFNSPSLKDKMRAILTDRFKLAFLRMDLQHNFQNILKSGKSYDVATEYIHMHLGVFNAKRRKLHPRAVRESQTDYKKYLSKHRLKIDISDERKAARAAWKKELDRMAFVLSTSFNGSADVLKRDRIQRIMDDYIPAKYASLKLELTEVGERQGLEPSGMRALRRSLQSAENNETIVINELVSEFMQENLAENEVYHKALQDFHQNWEDIFIYTNLTE